MKKKDLVLHVDEFGIEIVGAPEMYEPVLVFWPEIERHLQRSKRCKVVVAEEEERIFIKLEFQRDTQGYHYDPQMGWHFYEKEQAEEFLNTLDHQFVNYWGMKKGDDNSYYWEDEDNA